MERRRRLVLATLFVTIAALLMQVLAVSLPFWQWNDVYKYVSSNTTQLSHSYARGLWTVCDLEKGYSTCWHPSELTAWLDVVRALETTSMVLLLLVAIFLTLYLSCVSWKLVFHVVFIIVLCISAILILAGVILYGINAGDGYLHFAFAFAVLAAILALVAAIFLLVMHCCEKRRKTSTIEDRVNPTEDDTVIHSAAAEEQKKHMSQGRTASPFTLVCGECGRTIGLHGAFVDRSTSMLSLHSGKIHPTDIQCPDRVTRSTCMTPLHGIANRYRHRTSPIYCEQTTPEGRFRSDLGLHGPCPNSIFCCRCQHKCSKKTSNTECDCIIGENTVCDKCKDKQIRQEKEVYAQKKLSLEARPLFYGDDAIQEAKNVGKQQMPHSTKSVTESTSRESPVDNELDITSKDHNRSNNKKDKGVNTVRKEQSKAPDKFPSTSIQEDNTEKESIKVAARNDAQQNEKTRSNDTPRVVKQKTNVDMTVRVVDQNVTTNTGDPITLSNRQSTDRSGKDAGNSVKKAAKTKKPIRSRYAFDKYSGSLPNYKMNDKITDGNNESGEPTSPRSGVHGTGASVRKKSNRSNQPKKWESPRWN